MYININVGLRLKLSASLCNRCATDPAHKTGYSCSKMRTLIFTWLKSAASQSFRCHMALLRWRAMSDPCHTARREQKCGDV